LPERDISRLKDAKSIGLIGGAFDPIHYGHLAMAERVRVLLSLDAVVFQPSGIPPFKRQEASKAEARLAMTRLACADNPHFHVSEAEILREGTSYTIDTLRLFASALPKAKTTLVLGADAFMGVLKWHKYRELLALAKFTVAARPGTDNEKLREFSLHLKKKYGAKVKLVPIPLLDISSTEIRALCARGESVKYLLPDSVSGYIKENALYSRRLSVEEMKKTLKDILPERRFAHSLSTAETAVNLARIHGADEEKAYIAGLLHDCARVTHVSGERMVKMAKSRGLHLDEHQKKSPVLIHAPLGAIFAKADFFVTDDDILNAIKHHTTGRPGMNLLEKIVFTADHTEPLRGNDEHLEAARTCAKFDLNAAVLDILCKKLEHHDTAHPDGIKAREYILNNLLHENDDM
jgi:nicotinate-nucleotide adenylyltransferase